MIDPTCMSLSRLPTLPPLEVNNMKDLVDELQDHIHSSIHPHQDLARQTEQVLLVLV